MTAREGPEQTQAIVNFAGRVQGVGFRMAAVAAARNYAVTGYVRNLPDGRVQLVAEGEKAEVEALLLEIGRRMGRRIRRVTKQFAPLSGVFTEFTVRY